MRQNQPGSSTASGFIKEQGDGLLLAIKLQPRASRNEILGEQGGELRVRVTAPPVDAAANEALLRLLAEALDCPRGSVTLVRGQTSRRKVGPGVRNGAGNHATEALRRLKSRSFVHVKLA